MGTKSAVAILLAGGRGTRMEMLCQSRPKPMLPYAGTYRVVDFTLSNCIHSGIAEIAALVDHQRIDMTHYLKRWYSANDDAAMLSVLEPRVESYSGTADAVYQNLDYLSGRDSDTVVILAADHVYNMDYREMIASHDKVGAEATVAVVRVPLKETPRFGTVVTDTGGRIMEFAEKSPFPKSSMASMGIYVFNKSLLASCVREDAADPNSRHDFGYAILPKLLRKGGLFAYEFRGYWQDIGTVEAYYESHMDLVGERPRFKLDVSWPVLGERRLPWRDGSEGRNAPNSLIGPGCGIDGYVENSVLGPGVRVAERAEVRNSIVMANAHVGRDSIVDGCILDENVHVEELCHIGSGGGLSCNDREITVVARGVTVPARTSVGRGCFVASQTGSHSLRRGIAPSGTIILEPS
jgi:glucose-1-phosphate adenylyltransferase